MNCNGMVCYGLSMSTLELSEKYRDIAEKVIRDRLPELADVCIAYLASDQEKRSNGHTIFGECRKVAPQYSWCCPYDFMITVFEPNCVEYLFGDHEYETLIYHELLHVGVEESEDGVKYRIRLHDIEEFEQILEAEGLHWQRKNLKGADPRG